MKKSIDPKKEPGWIYEAKVLMLLKSKIDDAQVVFHPDTPNTYAAYQVIFDSYEIWINARNGTIIHAGRLINRA
jgi:hypothetical protein